MQLTLAVVRFLGFGGGRVFRKFVGGRERRLAGVVGLGGVFVHGVGQLGFGGERLVILGRDSYLLD